VTSELTGLILIVLLLTVWSRCTGAEPTGGRSAGNRFREAESGDWKPVFSDPCTGDWKKRWTLDGEKARITNTSEGMDFHAGPEFGNHAHHAVRETTLGLLAANFWTPGPNKAGELTCKGVASVMLGEAKKGELVVAVADPTHRGERIGIEIARKAARVISKDKTISVERLEPTIRLIVDVKNRHGASFSLRLGGLR
jgi:hypothetical protein